LFYGPSGSGKRTLTKCLLHELYKTESVHRVVSEHKEFKTNSTTAECIVMSSNYHVEVTPSEAEMHDRIIVQKCIKEVASSH
jgi:replication factor C subunit 3/5